MYLNQRGEVLEIYADFEPHVHPKDKLKISNALFLNIPILVLFSPLKTSLVINGLIFYSTFGKNAFGWTLFFSLLHHTDSHPLYC